MSSNNNSSYLEVSGQEASDILAAALQQMDGIIAGTKFDSSSGSNGFGSLTSTPENTLKHRSSVTEARIIKLVDDLKLALELCDNKQQIIRKLPDDVLTAVVAWLQSGKEEASKITVGATYNVQWGSQRPVDEAVVTESGSEKDMKVSHRQKQIMPISNQNKAIIKPKQPAVFARGWGQTRTQDPQPVQSEQPAAADNIGSLEEQQ